MSAANRKTPALNWTSVVIGLVVGGLIVLAIRFATYQNPKRPHYHANFLVYINGQRQEFKEPFYYEPITSCSADQKLTPKERVHMHDNISDVVHVHDNAVTWGNFFQTIGWDVTQSYIGIGSKILLPDATHGVTMVLNGQPVDGINLRVIGDRDRLLIDYGDTPAAQVQSEYQSVPATAVKYDTEHDPQSCAGQQPTTLSDRLKHIF